MTIRTTNKTVTFDNPFFIGDYEEILPPGTYIVETDEELLEGLSFHAYRRILTLLHLPEISRNRRVERTLTIEPKDLDEALTRDEASNRAAADRPSV